MADSAPKRLLVTDLDNTLWDWFQAWHASFSALLSKLSDLSGVPPEQLEQEIRPIHRARGTTEYSNLVAEIPSLIKAASPEDPLIAFDEALHYQNSVRKHKTQLYPSVADTLATLKSHGVRIVAYTESVAYWTEWRIRRTGLDGLIDDLYSAPDHDLPQGMTVEDLRSGHLPASEYGLKYTRHNHVPKGLCKPNAQILKGILAQEGCDPDYAAYVGDSLLKDIMMAQSAGVLDIHAEYGQVQHRAEYELLRRVSHWTDEDVQLERELARNSTCTPTLVCRSSFAEILPVFGL